MTSFLLAAVAVLSIESSMNLINEDLSYLSDTQVTDFKAECTKRGLTSLTVHSTDGRVRQIKCFLHEWDREGT